MKTLSTKATVKYLSQALDRYVTVDALDFFVDRGALTVTPARGPHCQRRFPLESINRVGDAIISGHLEYPSPARANHKPKPVNSSASPYEPAPKITEVPITLADLHVTAGPDQQTGQPVHIDAPVTFEVSDVRDVALDTVRILVAEGRQITLLVELRPE